MKNKNPFMRNEIFSQSMCVQDIFFNSFEQIHRDLVNFFLNRPSWPTEQGQVQEDLK